MQEIISFYRQIFEEELSKLNKLHFDHKHIRKKMYLSGKEELINAEAPFIPILPKKAIDFEAERLLNTSNYKLKYFSLARLSKFTAFNKHEVERIYPLLEHDAEIVQKGEHYYLKVDLESRQFIKQNFNESIDFAQLLDFEKFPEVDLHFVSQLEEAISGSENTSSDDLMLFPDLWSKRKLNARLAAQPVGTDQLVPCGVLALIEQENYAFSTLDELKKIERSGAFSRVLQVMFGNEVNADFDSPGIVCEELNHAQATTIANANTATVSVVSGPPGTGKSYTISNLAVEFASKGKSVLISSKNNEALEVIEQKIGAQLNVKGITVNPSKDRQLKGLKEYLKKVLGRAYKFSGLTEQEIKDKIKRHQGKRKKLDLQEERVEQSFELEKEVLSMLMTNPLSKHSSKAFKERVLVSRGKQTIPLWENLYEYYRHLEVRRRGAVKLIHETKRYNFELILKSNRGDVRRYYDFLRARSLPKKEDLYARLNHQKIVNSFPIWLVKASEISKVMPLEKEIFDLLIIDEASQCDIPSMIPLMQRAKKCVVVGDLNQLGHISFIAHKTEARFKSKIPNEYHHLCQHRDYSFLALATDQVAVDYQSALLEHFRSKFSIIDFSNKAFYENDLSILSKRPDNEVDAVEFYQLGGTYAGGVNAVEIESAIHKIKTIVAVERDRPVKMKTSIGVLSPFRKQVDQLFEAIKKNLKLSEIKQHQIHIGTAFSFQGNERDLMILSLAADNETHGGTFNYMNRKDVFNVSVTRARFKQIVLHSFAPDQLKFNSTLQQFFSYYDTQSFHAVDRPEANIFCDEIETYFKAHGYKTWQQYEISGVVIDVLAEKDGEFVAVDLVGFPGQVGDFYPLERYKMLERGNIKLFPLPYAYWLYDKTICLSAIEQLCLGKS